MNIAQTIFQKVKDLPDAQAQEILDFVDFIQTRYGKSDHQVAKQELENKASMALSIAQYAGMVQLEATEQTRHLEDFDAADFVMMQHESH
ncbi:DUF2281 domain-containing protein [Acinetobacter populi]|uniref:DUF2281 domain-containing protein n=1 Tax=Acinetobacter populi TaxID=1582270 RepID=A0A1Z9Z1P2_9GAMM|nr:DUF2281 domain-containing protein [Acinetobacter populi]OUY08370.1 hypothetical protein CAP51_01755 [Acinetobacter populi]